MIDLLQARSLESELLLLADSGVICALTEPLTTENIADTAQWIASRLLHVNINTISSVVYILAVKRTI